MKLKLEMASMICCSSSLKVWALGFFSGLCVAYLAAISLPPALPQESSIWRQRNLYSNSLISPSEVSAFCAKNRAEIRAEKMTTTTTKDDDQMTMELYSAWTSSLNNSTRGAPHLEDCKSVDELNSRLDRRGADGSLPPWTLWKGALALELLNLTDRPLELGGAGSSGAAFPPWIIGADEDNYPLTRGVQRDIWIHQHPPNCDTDPSLRFLVADFEKLPGFGMGAQIAGMTGLLAIAMSEKRILVTNYYNRADHDGCEGSSRAHWSCYFFPETSPECRRRALALVDVPGRLADGFVTTKQNYTSKEIWSGRVPRLWGEPWQWLQPTTEIDGRLVRRHRKMDRRWWRAQAARYLMRFRSEYTCRLLNSARNSAFGIEAARLVVEGGIMDEQQQKVDKVNKPDQSDGEIDRLVWSSRRPYVPRPLLSIHVRMGDKAIEMKVVGFKEYMRLAHRIRRRFPDIKRVWLSTEMQEVIEAARAYPNWKFYYSDVPRQATGKGNMSMAMYEASLGRRQSTEYPLVNFLMAAEEADFFVGALGSTWCYLIDGMRSTGGRVMSGYLSVNRDRFW